MGSVPPRSGPLARDEAAALAARAKSQGLQGEDGGMDEGVVELHEVHVFVVNPRHLEGSSSGYLI
jgi:hypothetical protein